MKFLINRALVIAALAVTVITGSAPARAESVESASAVFSTAEAANFNCISHVCLGDYVQISYGPYAGYRGQVIDGNAFNFIAVLRLDVGGFLNVPIPEIFVLNRPNIYPQAYPRPAYCPYGTIYDVYRGCVPYVYPTYPNRRFPRRRGYPGHF